MHTTPRLILCAALAVGGVSLLGCDSKDDKGSVTAEVHTDAAKDKMSNAGDAMKDAGNSMKDAAKETGGAMSDAAKAAKDKVDSATSTAPSAHVNVEVAPPTTRP